MMRKPFHIEADFAMEEVVYHKMAAEPEPGIVIGYKVYCDHSILYLVSWGRSQTEHFAAELTNEFEPKWSPPEGGGIDLEDQ